MAKVVDILGECDIILVLIEREKGENMLTYYTIPAKLTVEDRRYKKGYRFETTRILVHYKGNGIRFPNQNTDIACIAATSGNIVELV